MSILRELYRGESHIDFIGKRRLWFSLSLLVVLACLGAMAFRTADPSCSPPLPGFLKGLACGIEFKGGLQITASVPDDGPLGDAEDLDVIAEVREALEPVGAADAQIQVAAQEGDRQILVQTERITDEALRAEVVGAVADRVGTEDVNQSFISATWGEEVTEKAIRALIIFIIVVLAFITFKYDYKMAVAAVTALIHDLIITGGVYALVGFEVTPSTVIAILTILGYSLYDVIVVFDKVEEETAALAATGRATYQDAANLAVNEVVMRSFNTSLATLIPIGALLFIGAGLFGAETLKDLALALLVGMLVSTYSSVFLAVPLLSVWKEREDKYRTVRAKLLRDADKSAARPATVGAPIEVAQESSTVKSRVTASPSRPPSRPAPGSKKAKRRKRR